MATINASVLEGCSHCFFPGKDLGTNGWSLPEAKEILLDISQDSVLQTEGERKLTV